MKKWIYIFSTPICLIVLLCSLSLKKERLFYNIPTQKLNLYKLIGTETKDTIINEVKSFNISSFITLGEYKQYLESVKKDSSYVYYQSQFPDTTFCSKNIYNKYITDKVYEKLPAIGVSWDNAMNYCRWRTLKENKKDSITFIYRLPFCSEWLAANYYLKQQKITHDFDDNYSDWTIVQRDESSYLKVVFDQTDFIPDIITFSFHSKKDPAVLKRKRVLYGH